MKINIFFLFFVLLHHLIYPQVNNNELHIDSTIIKPDYRNHINISEYNSALMPLDRQVSGTGVWTELNPKVPRVDYIGVFFINKDTGWACGANGALIKTTNGGEGWTVSETNTTLPILKVKSFNGQIIIATGYDGLILRSTNGGETFAQITSNVTGDLWGLEIVNDTLGWACGATTLLKTTDAGESWQIVNTPGYIGNLWAIEFLNNSYGFIAADGKVLRTTDAGNIWEIIQAGDNQPLFIVDIIDSLHIAAAGYGGTSYRGKNMYSSDGGLTWITGGPLTFEPVNDIKYVNRDTGYVVLNNTIGFKTTNRGQQWTGIAIGGDWEMQFFKEQNIGYSVGTGLRIYRTENSYENWQRLIINDNFSDVFFVNEETGFAVSGVLSVFQGLYKTTDGGVNWNGVPGGPSGQDILFLDSLRGFIGSNVIYKTTDGGETWYIPNGGSGGAGKIFFIDETVGWAVRSNVIYKTTDSGENWFTQFTAPSSITFYNIHFIDSLYGWTANLGGRPYKTTNGGANWIQQTNLDIWESRDIYFRDSLNGFIINGIFELLRTTNSGVNWFVQLNSQYVIRNLGWLSTSHGIIVGDGVYETVDSGNTWEEILELRNIGLRKFQAPKNYVGYSIGYLGLIYKYLDTTVVPVELTSFQAKADNDIVTLNWSTSTETNNLGFQIERRETKNERSELWKSIGFVDGSGTTTEPQSYSFVDADLQTGKYKYRLKQLDYDGTFEYSSTIEVEIGSPNKFSLEQNYPNPFNPSTSIKYALSSKQFVSLKVFDVLGKEVATLINEDEGAGSYKTEFNASHLASGIYYYKLRAGDFVETKKMMLIK